MGNTYTFVEGREGLWLNGGGGSLLSGQAHNIPITEQTRSSKTVGCSKTVVVAPTFNTGLGYPMEEKPLCGSELQGAKWNLCFKGKVPFTRSKEGELRRVDRFAQTPPAVFCQKQDAGPDGLIYPGCVGDSWD